MQKPPLVGSTVVLCIIKSLHTNKRYDLKKKSTMHTKKTIKNQRTERNEPVGEELRSREKKMVSIDGHGKREVFEFDDDNTEKEFLKGKRKLEMHAFRFLVLLF